MQTTKPEAAELAMSFSTSAERHPRWLFVDMQGQTEEVQQQLPRTHTCVASALHRGKLAPPATAEVLGMDPS